MSELNASNLRKEQGKEGPDLVGTTELTSPHYMVPPSGSTADRPQNPELGTLRFNTDIGSLEYYNELGWETINRVQSAPIGGRGLFIGGNPGVNHIDYVEIATTGNAKDFGDITVNSAVGGALGSTTRAVRGGGYTGSANTNVIDYGTFATLGNFADFGDLINDRHWVQSGCNQVRGLFATGHGSPSLLNNIEYITIASTGNGTDFGDSSTGNSTNGMGCVGDPTRALFAGGSSPDTDTIEYVTIMSTGNGIDFGNLLASPTKRTGRCSSSTRGLFAGGEYGPSPYPDQNVIQYVTIQTLGNSIDFGDLTSARTDLAGCANATRGVFGGGNISPTFVNTIDYVTIATLGNAIDFGDLVQTANHNTACSNMNGGLL